MTEKDTFEEEGFLAADPEFIRRERAKAQEIRNSQWWKNIRGQGRCHYCGRQVPPRELTMDHLIPLARGGASVKSNIVPCCKECNSKKKYLLPMENIENIEANGSLAQRIFELVVKAATSLPVDVEKALAAARTAEENDSAAADILDTLLVNTRMAVSTGRPLCQDTGTIAFYGKAANHEICRQIEDMAADAVRKATSAGILRPNCVESISGHNTGDNLGYLNPVFHWTIEPGLKEPEVTVFLKGGGSENMSCQYSLPDSRLGAGRNLDGVRKCILDAVNRIQGCGCAPGILGICIGGDRAGGYEEAKMQLLRPIGCRSENPELAALEKRALSEANTLNIGPMGLGGKTTLLDVFVGTRARHPACYFVTIAYNCWCCRRQNLADIK